MRMLGQLEVTGDLDKAIIRRYLRRSLNRFRRCYDRRRQAKPNLGGIVNYRFVISSRGKVLRAWVTGFDNAMNGCVNATLLRLAFPKTRNGGLVNVKGRFKATPAQRHRGGLVNMPGFRGKLISVGGLGAGFRPHATIRRNAKHLRRCYDRAARKKKGLRGKVTARFNVRADGRVVGLTAWGMGPVSGCLAHKLRRLRFPPGTPITKVVYQFRFGTPARSRLR